MFVRQAIDELAKVNLQLLQSGEIVRMKAVDSEGHYSFTATGIEQCHTDRPILFDGKKHEPMNRKAYNKVHERYYADPVGFITGSMPNVTIKVSDERGNATKNPKNVPYNPLERGE